MPDQLPARPFSVWLIGPNSQVNSEIAVLTARALSDLGVRCVFLDEDECTRSLWPEIRLQETSARESARRLATLCRLFAAAETVTVVASRCPEESVRSEIRRALGEYIEIYCADSSAEPPSDSPAAGFEVPSEPELIVQPGKQTTEDSARAVLTWLNDMGYLSPADKEAYSTEEQSTILKRLEELGYI